jgi:predicted RNA-binding protein with PUA-like domain
MATYLLKTEPSEFSFADLVAKGSCTWDGVSNATALIHLRAMKSGDEALIYHTGDEKSIVGVAKVTKGGYEDPKQPGKNDRGEPKFAVVDLKPLKAAKSPDHARADQSRSALQGLSARHAGPAVSHARTGSARYGTPQARWPLIPRQPAAALAAQSFIGRDAVVFSSHTSTSYDSTGTHE